MESEIKPKIREPLEIEYQDGRREKIIIRRLTNTDMIKWVDLGFDKGFLVFRSVERPEDGGGRGSCRADQAWFDTLTQDSAFAIVEKALELNQSPIQKKLMAAVMANLQSWLSATPSTSSTPAATTPTS